MISHRSVAVLIVYLAVATGVSAKEKTLVNADCDGVVLHGAKGDVFFDMTAAPGEDAIDGMKIDRSGNLYVTGPGGIWILSAAGKHLGTIKGPEQAHNLAWGDLDGKTLYMAALTSIYRLRLNVEGIRP